MARMHFDIGNGRSLCGNAPSPSARCAVCGDKYHYGPTTTLRFRGERYTVKDHDWVREEVPPPPYLTTVIDDSDCPACRAVIWNNSADSLAQPGRRWGMKPSPRTDIPYEAVIVPKGIRNE